MNHAKKLLEHLKAGLFSHILISGTPEALDNLYLNLVKECRANNISTFAIEFSNDDPSYCYQYENSDVLFVKGLEILPPKHHQAYSLRTMLDAGKSKGLKSFIFCEQSAVKQHFDDYTAPFYRFCLRINLTLKTIDFRLQILPGTKVVMNTVAPHKNHFVKNEEKRKYLRLL